MELSTAFTLAEARLEILNCLRANEITFKTGNGVPLVPFLTASPGCGKSAMLRNIAEELKLKYIDVRMGTEDPVVLNGALSIKDDRSTFLPPERFPLATDEIPEGYRGWLIGFDELPDAPRACQSAAYKILLEREVGPSKLHPKAFTVAAGNRVSDNAAAAGELSNALKSRLVHLTIKSHTESFLQHIAAKKWDTRIYAYLTYKPSELNSFLEFNSQNSSDATYRCERTWDMVNCYLRSTYPDVNKPIPLTAIRILSGMIGSMASEFVNFTQHFDTLVTIDDIIRDPEGCPTPSNRGASYLLISSLASQVSKDNSKEISTYVQRLGTAFVYPFAEMAFIHNDDILDMEGMEVFINKISEVKKKFK